LNKELEIDKAIYLVDDATRTYRLIERNVSRKTLRPEENEANEKRLNGYRKIFRDGRTTVYGKG
jgi:hypothetical protein